MEVAEDVLNGSALLQNVRFVVDQQGQPFAVQLSIETWYSLLEWIEDLEDRELVRQLLPKLQRHPEKAGALLWDDVKDSWDTLIRT